MNRTLDAFLRSWPFDPWLIVSLLLIAGIYLRGWLIFHGRDPHRWPAGQPAAFLAGLAAIILALGSPIEPFASLLLQVHMVQHMLLMMVAPPLLWLGAPLFPLLRGLPAPIRVHWVAPFCQVAALKRSCRIVTHPLPALLLFTGATWLWHIPATYELALGSESWHYLQHFCFLSAALLFWYPVVRPYPGRPRWSSWLLVPCLLLADVQNTILSALLTFSDRILYPHYAEVPRLGSMSALEDQAAAGVIMWVPGSLAFLVPLFWIGIQLLFGERKTSKKEKGNPHALAAAINVGRIGNPSYQAMPSPSFVCNGKKDRRLSLPLIADASVAGRDGRSPARRGFDLLRVPLLGRFLRWRHARLSVQLPLLLLAVLVIYDGLSGPSASPMNLAGVLPWVHWRGLLIVGLLAAGNVFCMACPFMVPRTVARRWLPAGFAWPRWLRTKWLAVFLLVLFLWAYEAFSLWDSPWWTAWIALGYFVAALVIDGFFRGAAFCKYLCPIGQFNFVQSLVSPLEVKTRDPAICAACHTKECIRGGNGALGCELHLHLPRKAGNMDCTLCLECIHACPHDNIGIMAVAPGAELWRDPHRSGLGRFSKRPDIAAVILVLVFGAFANAAGMVGPIVEWQERLAIFLGCPSLFWVTSTFYFLALIVVPALAVASAAALSRWWGQLSWSGLETATRFSFALVPIGFAMWIAHYCFHFLTSYDMAVPTMQRLVADLGWPLGEPVWNCGCCLPTAAWLLRLEILVLDAGLLLSLHAAYRICRAQASHPTQALKAISPWALLIVLLFASGVWIVFQPMQMRGTIMGN